MADTKKLSMIFTMDNGDEFKYTLADPKDDLTKAEVDEVMQKMVDSQAISKKGHTVASKKEAYITVTTQSELA